MVGVTATRPRRTQAERREETRRALLDATVEALTELGYARTTTLEVQKRSSLSRGALLHHFPSKAELIVEAVHYMAELRGAEIRRLAAELPEGGDRIDRVIDLLWESFSGPLFTVSLELRVAARTDPELRAPLADEERRLRREILSLARELFGPETAAQPEFGSALELTLNLLIGAAMTSMLLPRHPHFAGLLGQSKKVFASLVHPRDLTRVRA